MKPRVALKERITAGKSDLSPLAIARGLLLGAFLILIPSFTLAQAATAVQAGAALPQATTEKIDAAVEQVLTSTGVPSASIAIVEKGEVAYLHAYGLARLSPPAPAETWMQYPIGSNSKQFTAAAILLLAQEDKLSLDDPVAKFLPGLTRANEVTLRMLLSHTSGYQDYWPQDYVMTWLMAPTTTQHIIDVWGKKPLDFDPGTAWQYSNTNYVIAGHIVELVSGMPLLTFLRTRIFTPLDMKHVVNSDTGETPAAGPVGYYRHALGPLRPAPQSGAGWMFAAGELAMPAEDLARWDISLIDRSLLSPRSYEQMLTPVLLKNGKSSGYGLGVFLSTRGGHTVIEHSGEVSGFVSENLVFPTDRAAIVVLTNQDASSAAGDIGRQLTPIVLNTVPDPAEAQALAIFTGLQNGHIDRSLFTDSCNAYFTQEAIDDFASSLKPLGEPLSFTEERKESRGGMIFRVFTAEFPNHAPLTITTYEMPDGKLEQYLVFP
jgi:D-alanyl-D-alanine carboxypeptidase